MGKTLFCKRSTSKELFWCGCFLTVKMLLMVICYTSGFTQLQGDYHQALLPVIDHSLIP